MTTLREAARALVAEIEPWRGKLSGQLDARAEELREAADAPPPGVEELEDKLCSIRDMGMLLVQRRDRGDLEGTKSACDHASCLIAELLAMFEAPAAVLRGRPEVKSIHAEAEVFPSDVPAAWCVQFWDRDEGNIWLVTFNAENAEELAEEYARAKAGGFYRKPPPPQLKVVK